MKESIGDRADRADRSERIINIALGASALSWAVLGLLRAEPAARSSIARITITALNGCVGALFLARRPVIRRAAIGPTLAAMPSIALSGVALKIAGPLDTWPIAPSILFAAGGFLTALSLAALGRCFALLPAVRGVVTAGPFRVVRHPAYAGELIMLAACGLSSPNRAAAIAVALVGAALLSARILAEERVLGEEPAYREYMARVRARLLPGIW